MSKLLKKDRDTYNALASKMQEILTSEDVSHYKNLRSPLQYLKRVHIAKSLVLTFKHDPQEDTITFYELGHHDNIYKK